MKVQHSQLKDNEKYLHSPKIAEINLHLTPLDI
jgi:hypothetical protein